MSDEPEKPEVWVLYIRTESDRDTMSVWSTEEKAKAALVRYVKEQDAEAMSDDDATVAEYFENADEYFEIRQEVIDGSW
jgi:hypothetical protein